MRLSLLPKMMTERLTDLSVGFFKKLGIRLLMLDFDNTIIPYTTDTPTEQMVSWLNRTKEAGVKLCVVSNSHKDRVKLFCQKYGLDCITRANKPFGKGVRQCVKRYGFPKEQCALAGDQIFTDTLGANLAGVRSILVKSIHNHKVWLKARHVAEKPFIYMARNRRINHEEYR